MPLNRPVFDMEEQQPCDTNQVLMQVLSIVKSVADRLDEMKAEHTALKEHIHKQESTLTDIFRYVRAVDSRLHIAVGDSEVLKTLGAAASSYAADNKLDDIRADCRVVRAQVEETAHNVRAVHANLMRLGTEQQEMRKQVERLLESSSVSPDMEISLRNMEISVRKMVQDYCCTGNWSILKARLLSVLDKESDAYNQLQVARSLYSLGSGGLLQLAVLLLNADLPVDVATSEGNTLLHGAAEGGHIPLAQALLARRANVQARTKWGSSPLMFAVTSKQLELVELLLSHGADVNCKDRDGRTSLHWAAQRGYLAVVQTLLRAGADTAVRCLGKTALDMAIQGGHTAVVQQLSLHPH